MVGHLAASVATGHQSTSGFAGTGSTLLQAMLCVGVALAGWAALAAVLDGWRGRSTPTGPVALIVQQVVAFVGLDLVEHALTGTDPWSAAQTGRFWASVAAHAAAGALAWVVLRLATRLGRTLARLRRGRREEWGPAPAGQPIVRAPAARIVALSSLSRRGPPAGVPAPHLI